MSGYPVLPAGEQAFKEILLKVKESVESGSTFADALAKHPKAFDELFVNLVAAGEIGGILDTILNRLAAYIEKAMKLKKQIKGAMVYPITIMSIAVIVVGVILVFVIPTFAKMFADFGGELPGRPRSSSPCQQLSAEIYHCDHRRLFRHQSGASRSFTPPRWAARRSMPLPSRLPSSGR